MTRRLGLLVNPIAGMGGRVGLHGTDGAVDAARARGAEPTAALRARRAVSRLRLDGVEVLTVGGPMGADLLAGLGVPATTVLEPGSSTTADDTRVATAELLARGVDLLLVAGGDGTIRDVAAVLGGSCPVLGIPAGVKMHSSAFAVTPEAAADVASRYLADPERVGTRAADVVDLEPDGPQLFGTVHVPAVAGGMQAAKSSRGRQDDSATLAALGREIAEAMEPGRLYLLGPGSTVAHVAAALGVAGSPLGVDAVIDGRLVGTDLGEQELLDLLAACGPAGATLVLGVVGGQGFLLGRGNQQLSPAVIAAVGADNVVVLAAAGKLAELQPPLLHVDAGDDTAQTPLAGYHRVRTGPGRSTVLRIGA